MARDKTWLQHPDVTTAVGHLDAHFAVLGCPIGSSRLEGLLRQVKRYQTKEATETLTTAFEALASGDRSPQTIRDLARGTWLTFLEPADGLAEVIDEYGVAADHIGRPGAYGRQWAHHASAAAWAIWVASGGHSSGRAGIVK